MGMLVGDTVVIENGGPVVEFSRTVCKDYQSKKAGLCFACPKGVLMSQAMFLAEQVVNAKLGLPIVNHVEANRLCLLVLGESIDAFIPAKRYGIRELPPEKKQRLARAYADRFGDGDEFDEALAPWG